MQINPYVLQWFHSLFDINEAREILEKKENVYPAAIKTSDLRVPAGKQAWPIRLPRLQWNLAAVLSGRIPKP
jgi:hypothetical protein